MIIARKMAEVAKAAGIILYSQWLPVKENIVSDRMSRDHNLPDSDCIQVLHLFIPEQISEDFIINQLPIKIASFLIWLMQSMPETMISPRVSTKTTNARGDA
jgi:hypothetical protein